MRWLKSNPDIFRNIDVVFALPIGSLNTFYPDLFISVCIYLMAQAARGYFPLVLSREAVNDGKSTSEW